MANTQQNKNQTESATVAKVEAGDIPVIPTEIVNYRRQAPLVKGMTLVAAPGTFGNADKLAAWCGGRAIYDSVSNSTRVEKLASDGQVLFVVHPGDTILRIGEGDTDWIRLTNDELVSQKWETVK